MPPVYATVDDYIVYTGVPAPLEIPPRIMAKASLVIDKALVAAVYDVDDAGYPTDPEVREVLREATSAQARPMVKHLAHMQHPDATQKQQPQEMHYHHQLTPEAFEILRAAGLLPVIAVMRG